MFKKTPSKTDENGSHSGQQQPPPSSPTQQQQQQQPPTPVRKLNLKTATREEMIEFIKQYNAHTKQVEARSREVYENYKATFVEKERISSEYRRVCSGCETIAGNLAMEDPGSVVASMLRDLIANSGFTPVADKALTQRYASLLQGLRALRRENEENKKALVALRVALFGKQTTGVTHPLEQQEQQHPLQSQQHPLQSQVSIQSHQQVTSTEKKISEANNNNNTEEIEGLKAKITKLQQLISKVREQLETKNRLLADKSTEINKLKTDLEGSDAINEECRIRVLEAEAQREKLEDSMRTFRREAAQRQEALEERALTAESDLASLQRDFTAYKERAASTTTTAHPDASSPQQGQSCTTGPITVGSPKPVQIEEFIQMQSENELLKARAGEAEKLNQSYEAQLEQMAAQAQKNAAEAMALREELKAAEAQHKKAVSDLEAEFSGKLDALSGSLEEYKKRYEGQLDEAHKEAESLRVGLRKADEELKAEKERSNKATALKKDAAKAKRDTSLANNNTGAIIPSTTKGSTKGSEDTSRKTFPQIELSGALETKKSRQETAITGATTAFAAGSAQNTRQGPPLFIMAKVQEQKDTTIAELKAQNTTLEQRVAALEEESHYHEAQEALLREQLRKATSKTTGSQAALQPAVAATQGGINVEYLKNIIIKYMETDEHDRLIPVISTIFGMTPEEVRKVNETRKARIAASGYGLKSLVTRFGSQQSSYSPQVPSTYQQK